MAPSPPLIRRVLWAMVPLALLLLAIEVGARVVGQAALRSRAPLLEELPRSEKPRRASAPSDDAGLVVVCVGDSWTFGVGVEADQAYPAQLQGLLRAQHGSEVQVLNLGQPGANAMRSARILRTHLARHHADLVIWQAGMNGDPLEAIGPESTTDALARGMRGWLGWFASYRLLVQVVARARVRSDQLLHNMDYNKLPSAPHFEYREQLRTSLAANMARADTLAMIHGIPMLVLTYALPPELPSEPCYTQRATNSWIRSAARARDLPVVDMQRIYEDQTVDGPSLMLHGAARMRCGNLDLHPNAAGYGVYAKELAAWIEAHQDSLGSRPD